MLGKYLYFELIRVTVPVEIKSIFYLWLGAEYVKFTEKQMNHKLSEFLQECKNAGKNTIAVVLKIKKNI